ncbi:MAG: pyridoxine 5'-phosphate synthase [Planctomycetales bacterium]|nr:pyridoxine 5'-phosphate synthase [Planctomycetales bacterium]MCA9167224.1 pyridoxine 5'-phosphate synthase [Planctomycetales bacterium]
MANLGVNIDHVATVRQARRTYEPDPIWAAAMAELGGADCITLHLREDRRHIIDRDVRVARETVQVKLNLEMACVDEIIQLAREVRPDQCTLVPERREEVTTEGGLDIITHADSVRETIAQLHDAGISVSLFLDPIEAQIEAAKRLNADAIELHTGQYALATGADQTKELARLRRAGELIRSHGMDLHAGHGLNYQNACPVAALPEMGELNIGHSIVARAIFVGLQTAVREMKELIRQAGQ